MKPLPVTSCLAVSKLYNMSWPSGVQSAARGHNYSRWSSDPSKVQAAEWMLRELDKALEEDRFTHEANNEPLTNNLAIRHRVEEVMKEVGIGATFSKQDEKSRKHFKPYITVDSGFVQDLRRLVKTGDGWDTAQDRYASLKKTYEQRLKEAQQEENATKYKAEQAQAAVIEKRKKDMELAAILVRYELPIESSWDDVLESLLAKNNRLALAVAMEQVRGDFSYGPRHVRNALYDPVDEDDKLIIADVEEAIENWDGDGRVFRDCTWNYGAIYATIDDKQLVADVQTALSESQRY